MTDNETRPSPEALLKEAKSERLGKLKIFLGAAPGVGKTYAMLGAAKARLNDGIDVVIGIVETHQRSETMALATGIEVVSKQKIDYRGLSFEEMDIDAVLKRKPKLVLVDELAHTNIPGARHPKRYLDVQEILEAGIDVYTTLNVQHIESLNDIVTRVTGVKVRETVPDSIVQMANAIELIDLPPDELLQRLKEGKVYIPEQARLASQRFFTPGNLTALRELALRQAAERVDDQMTNLMRRHAITGPWPTSNRVMVCIANDNHAAALVRAARRTAERRQASWLVLHVETNPRSTRTENVKDDVAQAMALAESLGAETMTLTSNDPANAILRIARERNVNTIVMAKSQRPIWSFLTKPSVSASVIKNGQGFDILLISDLDPGAHSSETSRPSRLPEIPSWRFSTPAFGKTLFIVVLSCMIGLLAGPVVGPLLLPFLFMVAIFLVALDGDLVMSLLATALSAIALDLLMTAPHFSLLPAREEDATILFFFIATSLTISLVADRARLQMKTIQHEAERTQSLFDFSKSIAAAATTDDVAQTTVRRIAITLGAHVAVLLPHNENLTVAAAVPADLSLDTASSAAMDWVWRHHKPAGFRSDTLPNTPFYGLPLQAGTDTLGVIAVRIKDGSPLTPAQNNYLAGITYQAAAAIERARLVTDVAQARLQTEMEKLRTSLLSSVSRDMRDPLDSIILTARNLRNEWEKIDPDQRLGLVFHIEEESDRLDRFIENFLDMTELVTDNIRLSLLPTDLRKVCEQAMERLVRILKERDVVLDFAPDLPLLEADPTALLRVFVNILENACSYSLPDRPIKISARQEGEFAKVVITDQGIGIPESERQRVFDMFYRIKKEAEVVGSIAGAGLGLSICRGFIQAHHGHISAQAGDNGIGTSIVISLPLKFSVR